MEVVKALQDICTNITVLDSYLDKKVDPYYSFAIDLIKRGTCFCVVSTSDGMKFYPSRFIGYRDNSMEKHLNNLEKDGRVTTPAISSVLHAEKPLPSTELNHMYCMYCDQLGFTAREKGSFGVERKFWVL